MVGDHRARNRLVGIGDAGVFGHIGVHFVHDGGVLRTCAGRVVVWLAPVVAPARMDSCTMPMLRVALMFYIRLMHSCGMFCMTRRHCSGNWFVVWLAPLGAGASWALAAPVASVIDRHAAKMVLVFDMEGSLTSGPQ